VTNRAWSRWIGPCSPLVALTLLNLRGRQPAGRMPKPGRPTPGGFSQERYVDVLSLWRHKRGAPQVEPATTSSSKPLARLGGPSESQANARKQARLANLVARMDNPPTITRGRSSRTADGKKKKKVG